MKKFQNTLIIFIEIKFLTNGFLLLKICFISNQDFLTLCEKWPGKIFFNAPILKDRSFHQFPKIEENDFSKEKIPFLGLFFS